ncbi:MAG: hypothetical protein AAGA29_07205 [Planctomycetota bacterium]
MTPNQHLQHNTPEIAGIITATALAEFRKLSGLEQQLAIMDATDIDHEAAGVIVDASIPTMKVEIDPATGQRTAIELDGSFELIPAQENQD